MNFCCFSNAKNVLSPRCKKDMTINNLRLFSYKTLRTATQNFHSSNILGGGGFGFVYKGILTDGIQVAVKSLSAESEQGLREFLTEIDMISNVRHPNLVKLFGCCIEGRNRILVYEYLENNSLASSLLGPRNKCVDLSWAQRVAISIGTAQGLAFLHEETKPHIVHRDIKASNILLDASFKPKIGDFGLAKLFPDNVTHVTTRVAGSMGYMAPEYALLGQLTKKADIYSFGVLLLEIVSGRSNSKSAWGENLMLLVEWTWKLREEDNLLDILDPELVLEKSEEEEVLLFIKVALFCIQEASNKRPSMKRVVKLLCKEAVFEDNLLTPPGVYKVHSTVQDSAENNSEKVSPPEAKIPVTVPFIDNFTNNSHAYSR